jgi:hypothetical protein
MTFPLGAIRGTLIEHGDGTVSYRKTGALVDTFRVRIADVTGFATGGMVSLTTRMFRVIGGGTELAATDITRGGAELVESWFRAHPDFGSNHRAAAIRAAPSNVADELVKLAALKEAGHLTEEEFATQKARLLG